MSHSYDNTLLQRMGFSDPDRRTPQHDDACIAIATDPERLIRAVRERLGVRDARCDLEVPLQKGDGKYATTVGFIDAMVTWTGKDENCLEDIQWIGRCPHGFARCTKEECKAPMSGPRVASWMKWQMLVEVKTRILGIGDLLRQMNLYREYRITPEYTIWSLDPDDSKYTALLSQQGYQLITGSLP